MVNTSLKKLKHHLDSFDVVVKERTTATAITKGTWGFEHIKACFKDEIIPFVKALKDLFNSFDQFLIDEPSEVQNVLYQIKHAVEQHRVESNRFQAKMNKLSNENERLLEQAISKDIVNIVVTSTLDNAYDPVHECERCVKLETELQKDFIKIENYDKLFKQYTTLEKHFLKDNLRKLKGKTIVNEAVISHPNYPEMLKVGVALLAPKLRNNRTVHSYYIRHTQEETATLREIVKQERSLNPLNTFLDYAFIKKLKERIKSLSGNMKEEKIKQEPEEIKAINIELDYRVTKLIAENEHLKQTYKQLYDSIKSSCIRLKEQCHDLIEQVNIKSAENSNLNASLQVKVLVITALKDTLSKIKGNAVVNEAVILHPIDPELLKIDVPPLAPKLRNNMTAYYDYLKHTQEETVTLRETVEHERSLNPLNTSQDYACKYTKRIRELLIILKQTCPCIHNLGDKLMAVTPMSKTKKVRFTDPVTSTGNTPIKTSSSSNVVYNKPMLSSTGVNLPTSASGSQTSGNTKKDRIQRTPSSAKKNKLEAYPRNVRTSLQNKKSVLTLKTLHLCKIQS
nr:hypothetical protein [Tanacetum cinerariifolium]